MSETLVNGYHLFAIDCSVSESEEGISFTEFENELGDGFYSQDLFGSWNGVRNWRLKMPTLAASGAITYSGIDYTRASYLWELFCETKVSGRPFALKSPRGEQYYLARFADKDLTFERMLTQLYTVGIQLKQIRQEGVSVFDVSKLTNYADLHQYNETSHTGGNWVDIVNGQDLIPSGDVIFSTDPQNGLDTVLLNSGAGSGNLTVPSAFEIYDAFFVFQVNEAEFAADSAIFAPFTLAPDRPPMLLGLEGTTNIEPAMTSFLNEQQQGSRFPAPMNEYKVIWLTGGEFSYQDLYGGTSMAGWILGSQATGAYSKMNGGEVILSESPMVPMEGRELMEHLVSKWNAK